MGHIEVSDKKTLISDPISPGEKSQRRYTVILPMLMGTVVSKTGIKQNGVEIFQTCLENVS